MEQEKGFIAWFAYNPVAANLLMIILIIGGIFSAATIRKEMFPDVETNYIEIKKSYLGAAPEEVESGIVTRIEEALEDVEGIKEVSSKASEGVAEVDVEVEDGFEVEEVLEEVKQAVDGISSFPAESESPLIYRKKRLSGVISLQIYGDLEERSLKQLAKDIKDELLAYPSISSIDIYGTRPYEIAIQVSETALQSYGLTFSQVTQAIRASSVELPGGTIKSASGELLIRVSNQAQKAQDFASIVLIRRDDGTQVTLEDVADVRDGFTEMDTLTRFNGKRSVGMQVFAVGDQNEIDIADKVKAYVQEKQKKLPEKVRLAYWGDRSFYLKGRLNLMLDNMKIGAVLVLILLALFLELKLAFWVVIGIPISFFGALLVMPPIDVSINVISLFGFILVLGLVVDDAIIIGESAYSEVEKLGHSPRNIIRGAKKVAVPATFGVLTTVAAFLPMLLSTDPQSAFVKNIAWVVILCLLFSLVESKMILPAHLVHTKLRQASKPASPWNWPLRTLEGARQQVDHHLKAFIHGPYQRALRLALVNRYATLCFFLTGFILSVSMVAGGMIRQVLFPKIASDFVEVSIEMEEGVGSEETVRALETVEMAMTRADKKIQEQYDAPVVQNMYTFSTGETSGRTLVELTKSEDRDISTFDISKAWRREVPDIPGVKSISFVDSIGHRGKDLSFLFKGKNLEDLQVLVATLKTKLQEYQGVYDIEDSLSGGKPELKIQLKPQAYLYNLSLRDVAVQVRQGFYGDEVQRFIRDGEEVKVMVRYPENSRIHRGFLDSMRIRTPDGQEIPFTEIAVAEERAGIGKINRVNGFRAVRVYAEVDKAIVEPERVQQDMEAYLEKELLPAFEGAEYERTGQAKSRADTQHETLMAFVAALVGIYALLAIPLKSYFQPLIVMSVIPFGIIGALVGHALLGLDLSRLSLFGIIALTGVVVNDSLILVNFINRSVAEGGELKDTVVAAGTKRFRAILLTSLTTFVGLVPILAETSLQAQIVIPMATSLAFGILFATFITLLLVPALYLILWDARRIPERILLEWDAFKSS